MSAMADKMYIKDLELELLELRMKKKKVDKLAEEILLLDQPESMREVALYIREVLK